MRAGSAAGAVFAGCSGWAYPRWKPEFYPPGTPSRKFLEYYATRLNSVEVNYTFRRLPAQSTVDQWLAQVGPEFRFSFKAPQRITHQKRLKDCAAALDLFYAAIAPVSDAGRLGVLLFQLPPNFKADRARLEAFLDDAARGQERGLRLAFEFRHASWFAEDVYDALRRYNVALCIAESDELETPEVAAAGFSCYRFRKSEYGESALGQVAARVQASARRGDVFAYFKHEDSPSGAWNAESLLQRVRV